MAQNFNIKDLKKNPDSQEPDLKIREVATVGIIGGGTQGRGLAHLIAAEGLEVVLLEKDQENLDKAKAGIASEIDLEISRWGATESEKRAILSRIKTATNIKDFKNVDFLFEALPEKVSIKSLLLAEAERILPDPSIVFATSTATLSITEIASKLIYRQRVIGMHFQVPVKKIPMVEVVRGLETNETTFQTATQFVTKLNKKPIEVYEYPGFISSRMFVPLLNEAMYIAMEGVAAMEGIDETMKLGFGFDMGPFELADRIGLDVVMSWMDSLFKELGDLKYRPAPLIRKKVRARHLGVKTSIGFYKYDKLNRKMKAEISHAARNE